MKVLELFSGTASFSNTAKELGFETFTIDNTLSFNPDWCIDILQIKSRDIIERFGNPDIIWASPPCTTFSCASIGKHWKNHKPITIEAKNGILLIEKTIKLIQDLKPKYWFIENPVGMLRVQKMMYGFNRQTVTYCQYGFDRMKPTDIWTNLLNWNGKRCRYKDTCHIRTPRGSKYGTQGLKNSVERGVIPKKLCLEILEKIKDDR